MNYSWDELDNVTWDDLGKQSDKIQEIASIIGSSNKRDIKHLDSAYMAGCDAFITSDKGDICSKADDILAILNVRVFHFHNDWEDFVDYCENDS
jgi:hypothetical protein